MMLVLVLFPWFLLIPTFSWLISKLPHHFSLIFYSCETRDVKLSTGFNNFAL